MGVSLIESTPFYFVLLREAKRKILIVGSPKNATPIQQLTFGHPRNGTVVRSGAEAKAAVPDAKKEASEKNVFEKETPQHGFSLTRLLPLEFLLWLTCFLFMGKTRKLELGDALFPPPASTFGRSKW